MWGTAFSARLNKGGFQSKNILFPVRQILTADFERVSNVCALAGAANKNTKTSVFAQ